ncbi:uncharacterized protein V1513DRAFT_470904 [Lipomyces chichibuensis]|uniref:uncharacterized protein n=1 Tax=Lipomyces chichibuensis TaxID=1546026 RepID=UPI00334372C0
MVKKENDDVFDGKLTGARKSSSSASASTPSSSSVVPSVKRRKRHGPAVSSAWITQDPSGRGRPVTVAPQQQQQEAEEAEFQLCRSLEKKVVDSGVMRSQRHARDIAAQIVRGFRTDLHRTGVDDGAAFAWVFGGVDGIDKIDFDIQFEDSGSGAIATDVERAEDVSTTTTTRYVVEWCIDLGGASARFNRKVVVTDRGMSEDPNIEM